MPRSEFLDRAAMWGHLHEPLIAARFAETHGVKTRRVGLIRHESEPWRLANLDRQVAGCPDGPCLLEIKNRSAWKAADWGPSGDPEGVPDSEALQTHWYLSVTGYRHAHVGVLINGNDDRYYRVEADDELAGDVTSMARDVLAAGPRRRPAARGRLGCGDGPDGHAVAGEARRGGRHRPGADGAAAAGAGPDRR